MVEGGAIGVRAMVDDASRDAACGGDRETRSVGAIADDHRDATAECGAALGVDQRREIRPATGDQHGNARVCHSEARFAARSPQTTVVAGTPFARGTTAPIR
jgi:hypothetical protein